MVFPKPTVLLLLSALGMVAFGQGVLPYSPDASQVRGMAAVGGRLFAGTDAGLFASEDDGRTWRSVAVPRESIRAMAVYGGAALAATDSGLYRSGSDGMWERIASGDSVPFASIKVVGNILEASSWDSRWISPDGGIHWSRAPVSLAFANTRALCASPRGYLFAFDKEGFKHISKDSGASWEIRTPISGGGGFWDVQTRFAADDIHVFYSVGEGAIRRSPGDEYVFVPRPDQGSPILGAIGKYLLVGYKGGMSRSHDHGDSFQTVGQGLGSGQTLQLASGSTSVFARMTDGVYRSRDSGQTWKKLLSGNEETNCIAARGKEVYVPLGSRLYHSLDDGESWTWVENELPGFTGERNTLAITSNGLFHVGGGSLWHTVSQGRDWDNLGRFSGDNGVWAMTTVGDRVLIALDRGILASDDFGKTWKDPNSVLPPMPLTSVVSRGQDIYATGARGAYGSMNGGKTWSLLTRQGLTETQYAYSLALSGDTLYAGMEPGDSTGLYFSRGPGSPWQAVPGGSQFRHITALQVVPGRILAGFTKQPVAALSLTSGTWDTVGPVTALDAAGFFPGPSRLFAFSNGQGIFASGDGGLTWEASKAGLASANVISMAVLDDLYIGTARDGLFRRGTLPDWTWGEPMLAGRTIWSLAAHEAFLFAMLDGGEIARIPRGGGVARVTRLPGSAKSTYGMTVGAGSLYVATDSGLFAATLPGPAPDFAWSLLRKGVYMAVAIQGSDMALIGPKKLLLSRDGGMSFPDSLNHTNYGRMGAEAMGFTTGGDLIAASGSGLMAVGNSDRKVSLATTPFTHATTLAHRGGTWAAASGVSVYVSKDGGPWKVVGSNPAAVNTLAFSGDTLYAGSYRQVKAIYVDPAGAAIGKGTGKPAPAIRLFGIKSTAGFDLRYSVPRACRLTLTLASVDGRSVRLFERVTHTAGEHIARLPPWSGRHSPLRYILETEDGSEIAAGKPSVQSGWIGFP